MSFILSSCVYYQLCLVFGLLVVSVGFPSNLDKKFRNLKKEMPMSLGALNDEGIKNFVNLPSEEFSQEETNLLNQDF